MNIKIIRNCGKRDIAKNKYLRNKVIEALILKCQEKILEADDAFVKKKMYYLRTAHRIELANVRLSKRTRSSADAITYQRCGILIYYFLPLTIKPEEGNSIGTGDSVILIKYLLIV